MAVIREQNLSNILKRQASPMSGLLVYGGDETAIIAVVDRVLAEFGRDATVRRLRAADVRSDPAILDDAVRSISLLGGREMVIVHDCDDAIAPTIESVMGEGAQGNFALFVAGALGKSSKLRKLAEESKTLACLPVYEPKAADVLQRVADVLRKDGLAFDAEAAELFRLLCGADMALALKEAEKLALYCLGRGTVSAADVAASCGQGGTEIDAAIDAAFDGDFAAVDRLYAGLDESDQKALFPLLSLHLARLQNLRADADRLGSIEAALGAAKPPIFFGRKDTMARQLRVMPLDAVIQAQVRLEEETERARRIAGLAPHIGLRGLFSLAQQARARRAAVQ